MTRFKVDTQRSAEGVLLYINLNTSTRGRNLYRKYISIADTNKYSFCPPSYMKCEDTKRCIPQVLRCNGYQNCGMDDLSDIIDCNNTPTPADSSNSSTYIPLYRAWFKELSKTKLLLFKRQHTYFVVTASTQFSIISLSGDVSAWIIPEIILSTFSFLINFNKVISYMERMEIGLNRYMYAKGPLSLISKIGIFQVFIISSPEDIFRLWDTS